jgi:hypothetical protein
MPSLDELLDRLGRVSCCDVAIHSSSPDGKAMTTAREWEVIIQHHTTPETRVIARGRTLSEAITAALAQAQSIGLR